MHEVFLAATLSGRFSTRLHFRLQTKRVKTGDDLGLLHLEGPKRIVDLVILNPNIDKEYLSENQRGDDYHAESYG